MQITRLSETEAVTTPVVLGATTATCRHEFEQFGDRLQHESLDGVYISLESCRVCRLAFRSRLSANTKELLDKALGLDVQGGTQPDNNFC